MNALFLFHVTCSLLMTGLIWFVQVVHYPLMLRVGDRGFAGYARRHVRRTTWIVSPFMLGEALTAAALLLQGSPVIGQIPFQISVVFLLLIWLSTALLQIPCHRRLEVRFDESSVRLLVATNWIRTVGWTSRSALLVGLLGRSLALDTGAA